jgi:hypothetical protein
VFFVKLVVLDPNMSSFHSYTKLNINTIEFHVPKDFDFVDYLSGGNYGNVM